MDDPVDSVDRMDQVANLSAGGYMANICLFFVPSLSDHVLLLQVCIVLALDPSSFDSAPILAISGPCCFRLNEFDISQDDI